MHDMHWFNGDIKFNFSLYKLPLYPIYHAFFLTLWHQKSCLLAAKSTPAYVALWRHRFICWNIVKLWMMTWIMRFSNHFPWPASDAWQKQDNRRLLVQLTASKIQQLGCFWLLPDTLTYADKWHSDIWYRRIACLYRRLGGFAHFQLLYVSALIFNSLRLDADNMSIGKLGHRSPANTPTNADSLFVALEAKRCL